MPKPLYSRILALALATAWSSCGPATVANAGTVADQAGPIHVPLTMNQTRAGTYKADIDVRIGNLAPLPFGFDTGSTGLHVFADAKLDAAGSGVRCSQTPTSVTYGNPPRIIFSGVMCFATLGIGQIATAGPVPIAYLTTASCPRNLPDCKIPDLHSPKAMSGYGVFGAGLTGRISGEGNAPPPILSLPGRYGQIFTLALTPEHGELILGGSVPQHAAAFPLIRLSAAGERKWAQGRTCLFVDERAIGTCLFVSFDTGNGVAWIHNVTNPHLPQSNGIITPSTHIGFGPDSSGSEAVSIVAGDDFANQIHVVQLAGKSLTNTSIRVFFNRYVTYDAVNGIIYFSDTDPN